VFKAVSRFRKPIYKRRNRLKRKFLVGLLALWVIFSAGQGFASTGQDLVRKRVSFAYLDLDPTYWAYEYISKLSEEGIISGYPDNTFRPANTITRAEFAKIIVLAASSQVPYTTQSSFSDVPNNHWALRYIEVAKERNIISGYPDGTFRPNNPITRAEIAKMAVVAGQFAIDKSGTPFNDISGNWAYDYIMTARNNHIISGYPDGAFRPDKNATRAEASKIVINSLWLKIPATTKTLDEATIDKLSSISEDGSRLTFSGTTPLLESLSAGDIIICSLDSQTPTGLLRKVNTVSRIDDQVVIETVQATIEQAVENGIVTVSKNLMPQDLNTASALKQGVFFKDKRFSTQAVDGFRVEVEDVVLYDHDGNLTTTNDQIVANGEILLEPSFDFSLVIENRKLEKLNFTNTTVETAKLEIKTEVTLVDLEEEVELAKYTFSPITVMVGYVPVVITPVLTVSVGLNGEVSVGITTHVTQEAKFTAGLSYDQGGWSPVSNYSNDFSFNPPSPLGNATFKTYASQKLNLLLYGVVGPYGEINAYLELNVDIHDEPWWKLYAGLEGNVGVNFDALGEEIADHSETVIDYKKLLAQAEESYTPSLGGAYAYVCDGTYGFKIFDVLDPTNPRVIGSVSTGYAISVFVSGTYAYVAGGDYGFKIIDISDPTNPSIVGSHSTRWAEDVFVSGTYAYMVDRDTGLKIIDISDPTNPRVVGSYNMTGDTRGIFVSGDFAYVTNWSSGLHIIDVSDPANPVVLGNCLGWANKVFVVGSYAYVAADDFYVVDVSDPANPEVVGFYDTNYAFDVSVSGSYAYLVTGASGHIKGGLQIIDISDPKNPQIVSSLVISGGADRIFVFGHRAYVASWYYTALRIVDISNPADPKTLKTYAPSTGHAFYDVFVTGL
jgi:hypothetical protein